MNECSEFESWDKMKDGDNLGLCVSPYHFEPYMNCRFERFAWFRGVRRHVGGPKMAELNSKCVRSSFSATAELRVCLPIVVCCCFYIDDK